MNADTSKSDPYESLVSYVAGIHSTISDEIRTAKSELKLDSCWRIGERIVEAEQDGAIRARYGKRLIETLADELASRDVRGLSARGLWQMRRFSLEYDRSSISNELSWTHYRALMTEPDIGRRAELEEMAIRDRLPSSTIENLVRSWRDHKARPTLTRPAGALWRYEVEDKAALGADRPGLLLNLGFGLDLL